MPNNQFEINVNNGVAFVVDNDVRSVKWMEVYPSLFNQSKSLLHANIECLFILDDDTQNSINIYVLFIQMRFWRFSIRNYAFMRLIWSSAILVIFAKLMFSLLLHKLYNGQYAYWMHKIDLSERCGLRASLNMMAPNFEFCCISLRNFIGNHMMRFTVWRLTSLTFGHRRCLSVANPYFRSKLSLYTFIIRFIQETLSFSC